MHRYFLHIRHTRIRLIIVTLSLLTMTSFLCYSYNGYLFLPRNILTNLNDQSARDAKSRDMRGYGEFRKQYLNLFTRNNHNYDATRTIVPTQPIATYSNKRNSDTLQDSANVLNWTRRIHDTVDTRGRTLQLNGSDFQCVLQNTSKLHDERRYHVLPANFRRFLDKPQPHSKCACASLLKPWKQINSDVIDMLFLVKSAPSNLKRRRIVRGTWGSIAILRGMRFATIFLVGIANTREEQELLKEENEIHGDLLQCDVLDEYKNLPLKVLSSFRWLLEGHVTSTYYTVTDDDCVMNVININTFYLDVADDDVMYCGFLYDKEAKPLRKPKSKWYISKQIYSKGHFPTFCHGGMWTVTKSLMRDIYCVSELTERNGFHLEDVYVTGILRQKLGYDDDNIKPVTTKSGRKLELMYYPWDETDRVYVKMILKWRRYNNTLPWGSKAMVAGQPIMTSYDAIDTSTTDWLVEKWKKYKLKKNRKS